MCTEGFPSQPLSCGRLLVLLSTYWNHPLAGIQHKTASWLYHTPSQWIFVHTVHSAAETGGFLWIHQRGARIGLKQRDTSKKGLHVRGKRLQCVGKCCSTRIPKVNRLSKAITQLYNCEQTTWITGGQASVNTWWDTAWSSVKCVPHFHTPPRMRSKSATLEL